MKKLQEEVLDVLSPANWKITDEIRSEIHRKRKKDEGDAAQKPLNPDVYRELQNLKSAGKAESRERDPGLSEWRRKSDADRTPRSIPRVPAGRSMRMMALA